MKRFILIAVLGLVTLSCSATIQVKVASAAIYEGEETIYNGRANGSITFNNTKISFKCWIQGESLYQTYTLVEKLDCEIPTWVVKNGNALYLLSMTKEFISIANPTEGSIIIFKLKQ